MTDAPAESGSGVTERTAPPTPSFTSSTSSTAPASRPVSDDSLFERLLDHPKFAEQVERAVHRTKDRRFQALGAASSPEGIAALESFIKAAGGDVQKGVRDYRVDQMLQQVEQEQAPAAPVATVPGRTDAPAANDDVTAWVSEILTDAGIAYNDPDYVALVKKDYAAAPQFQKAVTKLIAQRAKQAFQPGAASGATTGGQAKLPGEAPTKDEKRDQLTTRLNELMKHPVQNSKEINKVSAELRTATTG